MTLRELLTLFPEAEDGQPALTERQVRYLISKGFMPRPRGGRTYADYGDDHVAAVRRYRRLRGLGLTPLRIEALLAGGELVPVPVRPGLAVLVDVAALRGSADARGLATAIEAILSDLMQETPDDHGPGKPQ